MICNYIGNLSICLHKQIKLKFCFIDALVFASISLNPCRGKVTTLDTYGKNSPADVK